ncbi:hypothetical protein HDE_12183 [Halotydeus destructor]|nr:hypothetical protein HDE_12183 [Halotydeus destructor]
MLPTTRDVFHFISLALCSIGIAWQSLITVDRYLSYPTKLKPSTQKSYNVELPAASICLDYIPDEKKVKQLYPDIYEEERAHHNASSWQIWTQYLTVKQLHATSIKRKEAIKKCSIYSTNMTKLDCKDWKGHGNTHISWAWKCFTLFDQHQQLEHMFQNDVTYRTEDLRGLSWFEFSLDTENYKSKMDSSDIGVTIHSNTIPVILDEGSKTFRKFDFAQYNHVSLAYTRQVVNYLQAPYPTRCIKYKKNGEPNRRDKLVDKCVKKMFYENTGYFPCDILIRNLTSYGDIKFANDVDGPKNAVQERYDCNRRNPYPDCHTLEYLIDVKGITNTYLDEDDGSLNALSLCSMGIAWQSIITIDRYLSYPIKIKTYFEKPDYIELPAASICLDYIPEEVRVQMRFPQIYKEKQANHNTSSWQIWTQYLTLEQFISTTIHRAEAIGKCSFFSTNMTEIDCKKWAGQRNDMISWFWKCFTIFSEVQQQYYLSEKEVMYRSEDVKGFPWFHFDLNTEDYKLSMDSSEIGLGIHPKVMPIVLDEGSKTFRKFDFARYNRVAMAYTRQLIERLEAPYPNRCVEYEEYGKPTKRAKIVNRCAQEKYYENTGYFPCDILTADMTTYGKTKFGSHIKGHANAVQERFECNRLFPYPDCDTLSYVIDVKGTTNQDLDDNGTPDKGSFRVSVYGPSEDTMVIRERPAFQVFDLYSYLGNLLSLWVGVSVSGSVRTLARVIEKRLNRKPVGQARRMRYTESRYYRCLGLPSYETSTSQ